MHDDLSARAAFNRHGGVDATSAQDQVEDLPRKEKAVGWEETALRDTSTTEPGVTGLDRCLPGYAQTGVLDRLPSDDS